MGIDNFTKLVKKFAPDAIENKTYKDFSGEKWVIDASIFFYRFCHDPESKKSNPHIDGFYRLFHRLYKNGIRPILILDGEKPNEKLHTLQKRSLQKQKQLDKVEVLWHQLINLLDPNIRNSVDLQTFIHNEMTEQSILINQILSSHKEHHNLNQIKNKIEELQKTQKNIIKFQPDVYSDIIQLCHLFDVPIYKANGEADALCAKLCCEGGADAIMSEDSDILLYRGQRLIRKFNWTENVELIDLNKLLDKLKINYDQFVDLCILCGTDYTVHNIQKLGPITAYDYILKGLTIEQIVESIQKSKSSNDKSLKIYQKFDLPQDLSDFNYQAARNLVKNAHQSEIDVDTISSFDINKIKIHEIKKIMIDKCHYEDKTLEKHYQQIIDTYNQLTQPKKQKIKILLKNTK